MNPDHAYAKSRRLPKFLVLMLAIGTLSACSIAVNSDIDIAQGAKSDGGMTVNGDIHVGADAVVTGSLRGVNGSIDIKSGAHVEHAQTVNGTITLGDRVKASSLATVNGSVILGSAAGIEGGLVSVNGAIKVGPKSTISESVTTVNGRISLTDASVGGDVVNTSGGMDLRGSHVSGDITIKKPSDDSDGHVPRIVIGAGSVIEGKIDCEREVKLYISRQAKVGAISGAKPFYFDGVEPPPEAG